MNAEYIHLYLVFMAFGSIWAFSILDYKRQIMKGICSSTFFYCTLLFIDFIICICGFWMIEVIWSYLGKEESEEV